MTFEQKDAKVKPTKTDSSNIFWTAFRSAVVDELYVYAYYFILYDLLII